MRFAHPGGPARRARLLGTSYASVRPDGRSLGRSLIAALLLWSSVGLAQEHPPPEFAWRQILGVPRIGGRLYSIAVDPHDPRRIFVGTQEGTVLRSLDGGVTWRELEVKPLVVMDRSLGLVKPGLPKLGARTPNNFKVIVDTPDLQFTDRIPIPSVADPFPIRPEFFFAGFLATPPRPKVSILGVATTSRYYETRPAWRITICPGARYPLLVVTSRNLWGSTDDGLTYVRLFANPGRTYISNVACNASNPDQIAVATSIGLFLSGDGGLTFDQDFTAWPGQPATAVAFGPGPAGEEGTRLYSAAGSELFAGDPTGKGLITIYPTDPETAPWLPIRWIATTLDGIVWLATDDGARVSPDAGKTWVTAARTLLSRQTLGQVEIGEGEHGQLRVAVLLNQRPRNYRGRYVSGLHDSMVYASDDGGRTWHPFFHGLSRRTYRQMASVPSRDDHPAGWWVVTSGEVWTTYPKEPEKGAIDQASVRWAKERLRTTPPIGQVIDTVLHETGLSNEGIEHLNDMHRALNWVPRLDLLFQVGEGLTGRYEGQVPGIQNRFTHQIDENHDGLDYAFFIQALWDLFDVTQIREAIAPTRNQLHELRRQIAFATEDAWHERVLHLRALAEGMSDPVQIGSRKTRVLALEAMLDVWLRRHIHQEKNQ